MIPSDDPTSPAPSASLLAEHYRQSVLANVRGLGPVEHPMHLAKSFVYSDFTNPVLHSGCGREGLELLLKTKLFPHIVRDLRGDEPACSWPRTDGKGRYAFPKPRRAPEWPDYRKGEEWLINRIFKRYEDGSNELGLASWFDNTILYYEDRPYEPLW